MSSLTSGGGDSGKTGFGCSTIGPRRQGFAAPAQTSCGAPGQTAARPIVALSQTKASAPRLHEGNRGCPPNPQALPNPPAPRSRHDKGALSFYISGSPGFEFLNPLSLARGLMSDRASAVKGSLRPLGALYGRAPSPGDVAVYEAKGMSSASAGPDLRVRRSNPTPRFRPPVTGIHVRCQPPRQTDALLRRVSVLT